MRLSKSTAVSLEGDRICFSLLKTVARLPVRAKTDYTQRPQGCQALRGLISWPSALDDHAIDPPLPHLDRVAARGKGLVEIDEPAPIHLDASLLDEPTGFGRRGHDLRVLEHPPDRARL